MFEGRTKKQAKSSRKNGSKSQEPTSTGGKEKVRLKETKKISKS